MDTSPDSAPRTVGATDFKTVIVGNIKGLRHAIKIPTPRILATGADTVWTHVHTESFLRIIRNVGRYDYNLIRNCKPFDGFDRRYLDQKFLDLAETLLRS